MSKWAGVLLVVAALAAVPAASSAAATWSLQATVNPSATDNELAGVSCKSSDCTAVGDYGNTTLLAEFWNGKFWTSQSIPQPAGAEESRMSGVSCSLPTACTAVGWYLGAGGYSPVVERWNGKIWAMQSFPTPAGASGTQLDGVSCVSATACYAVGAYYQGSNNNVGTLAASWNGKTWSLQAPPNPSFATDAWLAGVSCKSTSACVAVGRYTLDGFFGASTALAEAWNGKTWSLEPTPSPGGDTDSQLSGVSCGSTTSCIAVGDYFTSTGFGSLAEAWNGQAWSLTNFASPAGSQAAVGEGVSCVSASACTAAGVYLDASGDELSLAEAWNGKAWTLQSTPNPAGGSNMALNAVSCASATACTSVGGYTVGSGQNEQQLTFAERYAGSGGL